MNESVKMTVDIDKEAFMKLKMMCVKNDLTIKEVINEFVVKVTADYSDQQSIK